MVVVVIVRIARCLVELLHFFLHGFFQFQDGVRVVARIF